MSGQDRKDDPQDRGDPAGRGRPGYHDPMAGVGGAAPARSALTLRLVLAVFGLVVCAALAVWTVLVDAPAGYSVVLGVLALVAVADLVVILRRKRSGEPG
jgi:hypothetical protein